MATYLNLIKSSLHIMLMATDQIIKKQCIVLSHQLCVNVVLSSITFL